MFELEKKTILDRYGKKLWMLRQMPAHAAHWLAGVYLPPHERFWLSSVFAGYRENNVIGSRGTSKSFGLASLAFPLYDALHKNSTTLILSASGFRGGKLLFDDIEKLYHGELRSQSPQAGFLRRSVDSQTIKKIISRQPDMWSLKHKSHSRTMTVPTNKADTMRGIRATNLLVDERNTFDGEVVQKVVRPMTNVGSDFRKAAKGSENNKIFQVSTIDYTFRDWHPEIQAQLTLAEREFEAQKARKEGNWPLYEELMALDKGALRNSSFSFSRFDYTDLIIPLKFRGLNGNEYEVDPPLPEGIEYEDVVKWDYRDECDYFYLYPVEKDTLEGPFLNGTVDEDLWLAEQRNVFISASGNVYPHDLIVKASDRPIYEAGKIPDYPELEEDFYCPILYTCGDPCVIGVDYAREADDTGIVVIRLGPLGKGSFDPTLMGRDSEGRITLGKTTWSNVVWAESHSKMSAPKIAERIRNLKTRYNIINVPGIGGGIGMDKGGGGSAVRDELAMPKPPLIDGYPDPAWTPPVRIFDPAEEDYAHFSNMPDKDNYWGGLEMIKANNQLNLEATMSSKTMLQKQQLYIGYYESPSRWAEKFGITNSSGGPDTSHPLYYSLLEGYQGVNKLKSQLVRVQSKVSESGVIRFFVPGRKQTEDAMASGKKDLYSAFIYACRMARHHLVGLTKDQDQNKVPQVQPIALQIGSDRRGKGKNGRGWTSVGWGGRR